MTTITALNVDNPLPHLLDSVQQGKLTRLIPKGKLIILDHIVTEGHDRWIYAVENEKEVHILRHEVLEEQDKLEVIYRR